MTNSNLPITITTIVPSPIDTVWDHWTSPEHITKWNAASDDWHCPRAENDLRVGGRFNYLMAPRGSNDGFDFSGEYVEVESHKRIVYRMDDGRRCEVVFSAEGSGTRVTETFDPEQTNSIEMQRGGWQAILDRFEAYVGSKN